jgi:hypothetical protein
MVNFGPNPFNPRQQSAVPPKTQNRASADALAQPVSLSPAALARLLEGMAQASGQPVAKGPMVLPGMTAIESQVFIKNLLDFPKDIQALLMLLAFPEDQTKPDAMKKALKKTLKEDPELLLLLENAQNQLGQATQDGVQKLLKMMGQSRMMGAGAGAPQMEEMFKMASAIQQQVNMSPVQALNTMMLLYLPPLMVPQQIQFRFEPFRGEGEEDGEGGGGGGAKYHLVMFMYTANLGKFKVSMGLEKSTQIMVLLEHDPQARRVLQPLSKQVTAGVAEDGLPPPLFTYMEREQRTEAVMIADELSLSSSDSTRDSASDSASLTAQLAAAEATAIQPDKKTKKDKKVAVYPHEGVSIVVVHAAYLLAKILFQLDDHQPADGPFKPA